MPTNPKAILKFHIKNKQNFSCTHKALYHKLNWFILP